MIFHFFQISILSAFFVSFGTASIQLKELDPCFSPGQCQNSEHLDGQFATDEYVCLELCNSNPSCQWFTFAPSLNFCELLLDCSTLDSSKCDDCLSGNRDCIPKEPECWIQGECVGTIDHFEKTESKEDCLNLCKTTLGCRWFTFWEPSSPCFLFKNCPTFDDSCDNCVSGESRCQVKPKGMSKLLVVGGSGLKTAEVINLDQTNPDLICENLPNIPVSVNGGMGDLFEGKTPIFCGGYLGSEDDSRECHAYTKGSWSEITSLTDKRRFGDSVVMEIDSGNSSQEMLLLIGGTNTLGDLDSTDAYDGQVWRNDVIARLPVRMKQHCVAKINETTLISMGGIKGPNVRETYFYDSTANNWTQGPSFIDGRNGLACGVLNWVNPDTGKEEKVVVAAGGSQLKSVDLLFMDDVASGWVRGQDLPIFIFSATITEYQNSLILLGGQESQEGLNLYQLDSPNGTWIEMKQTLKEKRSGHAAFLIPDELEALVIGLLNCIKIYIKIY